MAVLVAGVIVSAVDLTAAQRRSRRKKPKQPEYFRWLKSRDDLQEMSRLVLKNGLRMLVAESHESDLAVLGIHIATGRGPRTGPDFWVAPAALKMLFAGTRKRDAGRISQQVWAYGAQLQVDCGVDESSLWATFPGENTRRMLELFADLITDSTFPDSAMGGIRNSLLQEAGGQWVDMKRGLDYHLAWQDSALTDRGWEEVESRIQSLQRAQVVAFSQRAMSPENLTLTFYGDFLPESIMALAVDRLKNFSQERPNPAGAPPSQSAQAEGSMPAIRYQPVKTDISRTVLRAAYPLPKRTDPDYPAMILSSYLLAEGKMSYLNRRLVEQKKVATAIRRFPRESRNGLGSICLQLEGDFSDLDTMEIELFTELDRWRMSPPSPPELSRGLALAATDFFRKMETSVGRASNLLNHELDGGKKALWVKDLEKLSQVKPADITRVAAKYFTFDQARVTELLPQESETRRYSEESFRNTIQQILSASSQEAGDLAPLDQSTGEVVDLSGLIRDTAPDEIPPEATRTSILRGPELQIWELHSLPIVDLGLFFPGGLVQEGSDKSGMTQLMLSVLLRGSSKYSYRRRFETLEAWGGKIEPTVEKDYFGYRLHILAPFADKAMNLIRDVVRNKDFSEDDVRQAVRLLRGESLFRKDHPGLRISARMDRELFRDHPYARDPFLLSQTTQDAERQTVLGWYDQTMKLVLPTVIVIGDTPGTSLATYFAKHFSGSRYRVPKPTIPPTMPPDQPKTIELDMDLPGLSIGALSMLGPEGENEESLLIRVALLVAERNAAAGQTIPFALPAHHALTGLRPAKRGGRITLAVVRPSGEETNLFQLLDGILEGFKSGVRSRFLEQAKTAFLSKLQNDNQNRWEALLRFAGGYFSEGRFYSTARLIDRIHSMTSPEFLEVVGRYLSQKGRIEIVAAKKK